MRLFHLIQFAVLILPVLLCSCYSLHTDGYEPIEKATFWENTQHYLLGAHDCRRSPEKCTPFCYRDLDRIKNDKVASSGEWQDFKFLHETYDKLMIHPNYANTYRGRRSRYRTNLEGVYSATELANAALTPIVNKLLIIPIDYEEEVVAYNAFLKDVDFFKSSRGMSTEQAAEAAFIMWKRTYGTYECEKLRKALPILAGYHNDREFQKSYKEPGLNDLLKSALLLSRDYLYASETIKNVRGGDAGSIIDLVVLGLKGTGAALNTIPLLVRAGWGIRILVLFSAEKAEEREAIERAIERVK